MINFNALPNEQSAASGNTLLEGRYTVEIMKADMKAPKDTSKPDYLNLMYKITDDAGQSLGNIFDIIIESEKPLMQYKLKRFILGFQLPVSDEFELSDLCKIVVGKKAQVELKIQKSDSYPDKTVVDIFKDEIYYPIEDQKAALEKALADMPFGVADDDDEMF